MYRIHQHKLVVVQIETKKSYIKMNITNRRIYIEERKKERESESGVHCLLLFTCKELAGRDFWVFFHLKFSPQPFYIFS